MNRLRIAHKWDPKADVVLYEGDCRTLLAGINAPTFRLVLTSPPYNLAKPYEKKRLAESTYRDIQAEVIRECYRTLLPNGSICWEVGNFVSNGEVVPLDVVLWPIFRDALGMKLRNRIVWNVPHGLHAKNRFSGRYEMVLWFTRGDDYYFDLDAVRVPVLWPKKKYFRGPNKGKLSSNPLGKNPEDVWTDLWPITNVKANHPEKTVHPSQFPEELVRRLVLSLTKPGDWVLDPFLGSGTTAAVCARYGRKVVGAEVVGEYVEIAEKRVRAAESDAGSAAKGQTHLSATPQE